MAKKRPNKAEREYMTKVAAYGCIACEKDGLVRQQRYIILETIQD